MFNREIRTLWVILTIFTIAYAIRGLNDLTNGSDGKFIGIIDDLIVGIVCDFIPIMLLLVFHFRNFRVRK